MFLETQVREGCVEDGGGAVLCTSRGRAPSTARAVVRVGTGKKGKCEQGQICSSGSPFLHHRGTGMPG